MCSSAVIGCSVRSYAAVARLRCSTFVADRPQEAQQLSSYRHHCLRLVLAFRRHVNVALAEPALRLPGDLNQFGGQLQALLPLAPASAPTVCEMCLG